MTRSGRHRCRDARAATGHPGLRLRLPDIVLRAARLAHRAPRAGPGADRRGDRVCCAVGRASVHHRRRRRALLGGMGRARPSSRRRSAFPSARHTPAAARCATGSAQSAVDWRHGSQRQLRRRPRSRPTPTSCCASAPDCTTSSPDRARLPRSRTCGSSAVNVNGRDAYKLGALPITADAKLALQALTDAGRAAGVTANDDWVVKAQRLAGEWETTKREQMYVDRAGEEMTRRRSSASLNEQMQAGDVLVCAAGTVPSDITKLFDPAGGRTLHLEFGNSCMGYDIPAAIGVRLAQHDGEVYVLLGDGNYQMHPMELVTAMQERAKLTVLRQRQLRLSVDQRAPAVVRRAFARQRVQGARCSERRDRQGRLHRGRLRQECREHRTDGSAQRARRARFATPSRQRATETARR